MRLGLSKRKFKFSWPEGRAAIFDFFGSSPRNYWLWFLFVFGILFVISITSSFFLFLSLSSVPAAGPVELDRVSEIKINLSGLEEVSRALNEKESGFSGALSEALFSDPSL